MAKKRQAGKKKQKQSGATTQSHGITPKTVDRSETPEAEAAKKPTQVEALRCTFMGAGVAFMRDPKGGPDIRIEVQAGGVYERDIEDDGEWRARVRMLLATGEWEDVSVSPALEPVVETVYKLQHPDAEPGTPMEGEIHVEVSGKEVALKLDADGVVETDDPETAKALEAKGMLPVGEAPKE